MAAGQGVIGHVEEDGFPVIYRYVDEVPTDEQRAGLPWLAVISWTYDGSSRNGMPPDDVNARMIDLEDRVESGVEATGLCENRVAKTGNGMKELIYYIRDRDSFMDRLNVALDGQPRYPIEITFYHDPEWQELSLTRAKFDGAPSHQLDLSP